LVLSRIGRYILNGFSGLIAEKELSDIKSGIYLVGCIRAVASDHPENEDIMKANA
jgi:hypothetical protein